MSTPPSVDFGDDFFELVGAEGVHGLRAHIAKRTELQNPPDDGRIVRRLDQQRAIERAERSEDVTAGQCLGGASAFGRVFDVANSLFSEVDEDQVGSHRDSSFLANQSSSRS